MIAGGNCFNTAGFCVSGGDFVLTSLVSNGFVQNPSNEDITTNATATIDLTSLSNVPLGTVTLIGTVTQEVEGRLNPTTTAVNLDHPGPLISPRCR